MNRAMNGISSICSALASAGMAVMMPNHNGPTSNREFSMPAMRKLPGSESRLHGVAKMPSSDE